MRCSAAEATLLCSIGAMGVLSILEIEADLIETFFRDKVIILTEISPVDDGVNKFARIRFEVARAFDAP